VIEWLKREEAVPFSGWDFSYIANRMSRLPPPWSFEDLANEALRTSSRALDLGTGGGERVSRMVGSAGGHLFATEGYAANVPVARERLRPLGVRLIACSSLHLALRDSSFDLILSSKTAFNASEVARVLMPAGRLLTEQFGPGISRVLRQNLGMPLTEESDPRAAVVAQCLKAGLTVERSESADLEVTFHDVGAIVYYLRAVPWAVPDFSVDRYIDPLLVLHDRIEREGRFTFTRRTFLLIARRPA
jgi:SAM-dependent methyltransferase